jgi:hypothetical protein
VGRADDEIAVMLVERAITRVLHRYAQGIDRHRLEQVRSCYWDDATDAHLPHFSGRVDEYIEWLARVLPPLDAISHQLTNFLIDVDVDAGTADVESYCLNALVVRSPGAATPTRTLQCFRYVDRFERRSGGWRIVHRRVARDWDWTLEVESPRS